MEDYFVLTVTSSNKTIMILKKTPHIFRIIAQYKHSYQHFNVYIVGDLEQALLESEQLLGELSVMIRRDVPSVTAMSTALETMVKSTDNQCQELQLIQNNLP
jgi:hypothetical protein